MKMHRVICHCPPAQPQCGLGTVAAATQARAGPGKATAQQVPGHLPLAAAAASVRAQHSSCSGCECGQVEQRLPLQRRRVICRSPPLPRSFLLPSTVAAAPQAWAVPIVIEMPGYLLLAAAVAASVGAKYSRPVTFRLEWPVS